MGKRGSKRAPNQIPKNRGERRREILSRYGIDYYEYMSRLSKLRHFGSVNSRKLIGKISNGKAKETEER